MNFEPDKSVEEYKLFDLITYSPDYGKVYFPDKYLLAGHTPTSLIAGNPNSDCIYRDNRHIANDCAAASGGWIGAFCLDTGEEFYSKE